METEIKSFNAAQAPEDRRVCDALAAEIAATLTEAQGRIWHGHPVCDYKNIVRRKGKLERLVG